MKLNARQVETAKPKDKPCKLADGGACIAPPQLSQKSVTIHKISVA